uniref:Uncharacterized protein n=1 Tax=Sphaeramia orbicularis TaxID=375764 RepID=A0A672Z370_9TELE
MMQRSNLKFLVKLGRSPTVCLKLLLFEWHKRFKRGREEVNDDPKGKQLVRSDRRLTVRMMVEQLSLNRESVGTILVEELGMRKVRAKMVPKVLLDDQKKHRVKQSLKFERRENFAKANLAIKILLLSSSSHFPSSVNLFPRLMKLITCSVTAPSITMLILGLSSL